MNRLEAAKLWPAVVLMSETGVTTGPVSMGAVTVKLCDHALQA